MAKQQRGEATGLVEQLRELVRNSGQTLTELAGLTGVDPARLSRFLHGKRGLSQEALDRIVRALHIRLVTDPADVREGPPSAGTPKTKKRKPRGGEGA